MKNVTMENYPGIVFFVCIDWYWLISFALSEIVETISIYALLWCIWVQRSCFILDAFSAPFKSHETTWKIKLGHESHTLNLHPCYKNPIILCGGQRSFVVESLRHFKIAPRKKNFDGLHAAWYAHPYCCKNLVLNK